VVTGWSIVLPVKRLDQAKSRLRATLAAGRAPVAGSDWHAAVALAMALDTATAVLATPRVARVIVVTDDPVAAAALESIGASCVPDAPGAGLNPALRHGARYPSAGLLGVASLGADLPALRPSELDAALAAVERLAARAFVADATGTGTTLLAAPTGWALRPAYGPGSAGAHAIGGAVALPDPWPSLRQDVDTAADLAAARLLGLGPRTAALVDVAAAG
jgi:2-phospho-L-lactate guanylyltransferase